MIVQVHSIDSIEKLAYRPFEKKVALISIGNYQAKPPRLKNKPYAMLRLEFDDIYPYEIGYEECGRYAFRLYSNSQARQIVRFVNEYKDKVDEFICQCHYGASRSAAVAAAIKEFYDGNGIEIFENENYNPNNFVFRVTMEEFKKSVEG